MSEFAVKGTDLKKILEYTRKTPLPFAFNPGKSEETTILCLHKTKSAGAIYKAVKKDGEGKKIAFGSAQVFEKTLQLTCERVIPQMAKQMKRYLKSQKVHLNIEIFDIDGKLLESDFEEESAVESDSMEKSGGNETPANASQASSPAKMTRLNPQQTELAKQLQVLSPRIKALPPKLAEQLGKHLQVAVAKTRSGNIEDASKLVTKLEAVLDKAEKAVLAAKATAASGEPQAAAGNPEHIRQVQALRERMVKVAKMKSPATLDRQKAQTLQKAKGLVDSGKLDEANKLLDSFVAASSKKAPPRPTKPAPDGPPLAEMKKRTFNGIDFSDNTSIKGLVEKTIEEISAFSDLIIEKTEEKNSKNKPKMNTKEKALWEKKSAECIALINSITNADGDRKKGYETRDENLVDKAFDKFTDLLKKKQKLQSELKPLWLKDKKSQLKRELKKNKQSSSNAMKKNFGENFMEMAKMAEVMAKKLKFDPYNAKDGGLTKPMEMGEVAAIYGYSTQDYTKLNQLLRDDQDKNDRDKYEPYIKACTTGLEKLPSYTGEAVRCDKTAKYFLGDVLNTGIRTEKAFMSTGKTEVPGFGKIVTNITKIKTGKDISAFSLHQTEGEVLFPPGSTFKFTKFEGKIDGKAKLITNYADLKGVVSDSTEEGTFHFEQVS